MIEPKTHWRVLVKVYGEPSYIANGLAFESEEEAGEYARNLALRWTAVEDWMVVEEVDVGPKKLSEVFNDVKPTD